MSNRHLVLHDPEGLLEGELPLDRGTHGRLATAVLGWTGGPGYNQRTSSRSRCS
ncbi:hypothetical protein QFZ82_000250 [Streptomyces sp. V4I23]|uniref:hypothetical protein n=1 Tax=Streptomyces sp. V4I23 TaxID=3042282 RepID=UPI002784BB1A|nr:hypothetical protein [Streptomyces sp. V4I23]